MGVNLGGHRFDCCGLFSRLLGGYMKHLFFRAMYVDPEMDELKIKDVFLGACDAANAHIRQQMFYEFYPMGITITVILAESHAAIHTWPENGFALVDYFSCAKDPMHREFMTHFQANGFMVKDAKLIER
jgi:S-adenosylmethionine decarboxylase proenzyme